MIRVLFSFALFALLCGDVAAQNAASFDDIAAKADAARDAGNIDKAVTLYRQALHMKPDWKQGWWVMGSILYDANRYQEAEEAFLPLTTLDPEAAAGWAMAGLCEFEIKHFQDALNNLQNADKLGLPKSLYDVTQYHVVLILIRVGDFDRALELISRYAERGEENPKLSEAMGIAALRQPIAPADVPPADHELVVALGKAMCDAAASHGKEATAEFKTLVDAHPDRPQLHYLYGLVLLQSDPDKAIAAFQEELVLSPKHPRALISLAAEYVKRNEFATALPFAEKAVIAEPRYFVAHAMLGKILVEGDLDLPRGIRELETAVGMAPRNPQSHISLASAYSKAGRKDDAAKQRAEFLKLRNEIDASNSVQK